MPNYEYKCFSCEHVFEEFLPIAKRSSPEKKACPSCGEKKVKQVILSCPNIAGEYGKDIHSAKGGFKDAMQRVCNAPGIKGSKKEKELKNRYGL